MIEPVSPDAPALRGRVLMSQDWRDLTFLHWAVDPELVADRMPPGVRPDTFEGRTYVGLIPFRMVDAGFGRGPAVPWAGTFLETNVRLYSVDDTGRRGIVFLSLDTDRALVVAGARCRLRRALPLGPDAAPRGWWRAHLRRAAALARHAGVEPRRRTPGRAARAHGPRPLPLRPLGPAHAVGRPHALRPQPPRALAGARRGRAGPRGRADGVRRTARASRTGRPTTSASVPGCTPTSASLSTRADPRAP